MWKSLESEGVSPPLSLSPWQWWNLEKQQRGDRPRSSLLNAVWLQRGKAACSEFRAGSRRPTPPRPLTVTLTVSVLYVSLRRRYVGDAGDGDGRRWPHLRQQRPAGVQHLAGTAVLLRGASDWWGTESEDLMCCCGPTVYGLYWIYMLAVLCANGGH